MRPRIDLAPRARFAVYIMSAVLLAAGCAAREELKRIPSPDGFVDAVVTLRDGDVYEVYVVPRRLPIADDYRIFWADRVDNLRVNWLEPKKLALCVDNGRVLRFRNFWRSSTVQSSYYIVDIWLVQPPERMTGC